LPAHRGHGAHRNDHRQVNLSGASQLQQGDEQACHEGADDVTAGLAPLADGLIDAFTQGLGELERHIRQVAFTHLDEIADTQNRQHQAENRRQNVHHLADNRSDSGYQVEDLVKAKPYQQVGDEDPEREAGAGNDDLFALFSAQ